MVLRFFDLALQGCERGLVIVVVCFGFPRLIRPECAVPATVVELLRCSPYPRDDPREFGGALSFTFRPD
jgi:hypothetical protein